MPKGLVIKMSFFIECAQMMSHHASKAPFKERIGFHRYKK